MSHAILTYAAAFFLSFTILGPPLSIILESKVDIEIIEDLDEEQKETKKEHEDCEKNFNDPAILISDYQSTSYVSSQDYLAIPYSYYKDVHSPPPDFREIS